MYLYYNAVNVWNLVIPNFDAQIILDVKNANETYNKIKEDSFQNIKTYSNAVETTTRVSKKTKEDIIEINNSIKTLIDQNNQAILEKNKDKKELIESTNNFNDNIN